MQLVIDDHTELLKNSIARDPDPIRVPRAVQVFAILTKDFRAKLLANAEGQLEQIRAQQTEAETGANRMLLAVQDPQHAAQVRAASVQQSNQFRAAREQIAEKQKQLRDLSLGERILIGQFQTAVEIRIGDDYDARTGPVSIVLRDGVVVDIETAPKPGL